MKLFTKTAFVIFIITLSLTLFVNETNAQETPTSQFCFENEEERRADPSFNVLTNSLTGTGNTSYNNVSKPIDPNRPRLCTLFPDLGCPPNLTNSYIINDEGSAEEPQAVGVTTTPGQEIRVPGTGGNDFGNGYQVLISNLDPATGTISLQYTLDAGFQNVNGGAVNRYDLHLTGVNISPEIVSSFNEAISNNNGELPALPAGYLLGTTAGDETIVAIADTGTLMNLLEANDFWLDGEIPDELLEIILMEYILCPQETSGETCELPPTFVNDDGSCAYCTGVEIVTNGGILGIIYRWITKYRIPVEAVPGENSGMVTSYENINKFSKDKNLASYIIGDTSKNLDDPSFCQGEDAFGYPKNCNMSHLVTPDNYEAVYANIGETSRETSYIEISIQDAHKGFGGNVAGKASTEFLRNMGIGIVEPQDCSNGCWHPSVTVITPETGNPPGTGGDHHIYISFDPSGPTPPSSGQVFSDTGDYVENFEPKDDGYLPNIPIFSSGGYNVTLGTQNSGWVSNLGMKLYTEDGQLVGSQHTSYLINWEWCNDISCFNEEYAFDDTSGEGDLDEDPIQISQDRMVLYYTSQAMASQFLFIPPKTPATYATFKGMDKVQAYGKEHLEKRQAYLDKEKEKYLALNLSSQEKKERLFRQAYLNSLSTIDSTTTSVPESKAGIEKAAVSHSGLICSKEQDVPNSETCDLSAAPKSSTTIQRKEDKRDVECPDGPCGEPSENTRTHQMVLKYHYAGCEDIESPSELCQSLTGSMAMRELTQTTEAYDKNLGAIPLAQIQIGSLFNTPAPESLYYANANNIQLVNNNAKVQLTASGNGLPPLGYAQALDENCAGEYEWSLRPTGLLNSYFTEFANEEGPRGDEVEGQVETGKVVKPHAGVWKNMAHLNAYDITPDEKDKMDQLERIIDDCLLTTPN